MPDAKISDFDWLREQVEREIKDCKCECCKAARELTARIAELRKEEKE